VSTVDIQNVAFRLCNLWFLAVAVNRLTFLEDLLCVEVVVVPSRKATMDSHAACSHCMRRTGSLHRKKEQTITHHNKQQRRQRQSYCAPKSEAIEKRKETQTVLGFATRATCVPPMERSADRQLESA
jgi:hypothetical protein